MYYDPKHWPECEFHELCLKSEPLPSGSYLRSTDDGKLTIAEDSDNYYIQLLGLPGRERRIKIAEHQWLMFPGLFRLMRLRVWGKQAANQSCH